MIVCEVEKRHDRRLLINQLPPEITLSDSSQTKTSKLREYFVYSANEVRTRS